MKRHPAFDPPEYLEWAPDPALVSAYREELSSDPERARELANLDRPGFLALYSDLLRTRLHDRALARWVREGRIAQASLGTGEEAVTVGSVAALNRRWDVVSPTSRNAGALHMMGMGLVDVFRGHLGTADAPNEGRDLHVGDRSRGIIQAVSHMGTSVMVATGAALAFRNRGEDRVALTWVDEGATTTTAAHEGMNFAAVQSVPAVFVVQNNQMAMGMERQAPGDLEQWPATYGIPSWKCDGNNVLDVYACVRLAVALCREGRGPAAVVADTFRMGGHGDSDEDGARRLFPPELFEAWGGRDPIGLFEAYLLGEGIPHEVLERVETAVTAEVDRAAEEAVRSVDGPTPAENALYEGFSEGGVLVGLAKRPV